MLVFVRQLAASLVGRVTFGPVARGLGVKGMTYRQAAHVAALMYGIGGGLVLTSLLLPHDRALNVPAVASVAVIAVAAAVLFALVGDRLEPWVVYCANLGGTVLISIGVAFGGSDWTAYSMLYVWDAVFAFYFFEFPLAVASAAFVLAGAGAAILVRTWPNVLEGGTPWLLAVGTAGVVGYIVQDLMRRLVTTLTADPLTGVANRGAWDDHLARTIGLARRSGLAMSVLMLDLDHFKLYNDDHGHQAGDALLVNAVRAWQPELRQVDVLARYGGEEFTVLLFGADASGAAAIAERLRAVMPGGQTCSVGAAELEDGDDAESLVARADAALYKAKALGRDRAVVAHPDSSGQDVLAETSRWARTVREVLATGDTDIAFQPIRDLRRGTLLGLEALARPPDAGVSVEGLFATAQRMGSSRELDWVCRRSALARVAALPPTALVFINVAVASLLEEPRCAERMAELAAEFQVDPARIVLEVTEREHVIQPSRLAQALAEHRAAGFRVAIDDVGEGHSTFELLASVVPDYVKIASSLVGRIGELGPRSAIESAAAFGRISGAALIAEGIEASQVAATLAEMGVAFGQGYHLGPPQPAGMSALAV